MTGAYNTSLSPADEAAFQTWVQQNGRHNDLADYDLRGWWKGNGVQAANGHFTDQYKKPNHPTFSDQSQYNGQNGAQGGRWGGDDNQPTFTPSQANLDNYPAGGLESYFRQREPAAVLVMPTTPQQPGGATLGNVFSQTTPR
jgi:hypothetical protein